MSMHEKIIEIPTADGRMETFITHPEADGPFAPVVIYMDVWGLREELYDIARKVAVVGYYVLLPDLYYRQGRIRHQWRNERGQMISMLNLEPERQAQVRAPLQKLSDAMVVADSGAILKFLAQGEPVRHGAVGSIGYCMGGRHVICVAGAYPERFVAGACLHGTQLVSERDDSPHRLADRLRGELYCGFAENDPNAAPPIRQALSEALTERPVHYFYELHAGAEHGYALPDRDIHDKRAANRDWELIFAMFRRQLAA
jgi:carboxymethylenebutenolidase